MLIAQAQRDDRVAQIAQSPQVPQIPTPTQGTDWGFALIVCGLVGANLWQLVQRLLVSESDQQIKLMSGLMAQNQTMLQAIVNQNQILIEAIAKK
jgi:hypothetical protein